MAVDYVLIELDRQRKLQFDLNALCELEDATGRDMGEVFDLAGKMTAKDLRLFLWAGLIGDDPELTQQDVGRLVSVQNFEYVAQKIGDAIAKASPSGESEGNPTRPTKSGTGRRRKN